MSTRTKARRRPSIEVVALLICLVIIMGLGVFTGQAVFIESEAQNGASRAHMLAVADLGNRQHTLPNEILDSEELLSLASLHGERSDAVAAVEREIEAANGELDVPSPPTDPSGLTRVELDTQTSMLRIRALALKNASMSLAAASNALALELEGRLLDEEQRTLADLTEARQLAIQSSTDAMASDVKSEMEQARSVVDDGIATLTHSVAVGNRSMEGHVGDHEHDEANPPPAPTPLSASTLTKRFDNVESWRRAATTVQSLVVLAGGVNAS